jgi:hydrogenase nickel incorporation protein HypA/HybF
MHELTLCAELLSTLEAAARTHGFSAVRRVRLEIGRFACVEPEALRFGFEALSRGGLADGAALEILRPPGRAECLDCGRMVTVERRLDPCPLCGGLALAPEGGDEMRIRDLEVV